MHSKLLSDFQIQGHVTLNFKMNNYFFDCMYLRLFRQKLRALLKICVPFFKHH